MGTGDVAIGTWLGELGSGSPTPGGGAAAGVAAATGAALIAMVGHLTVGKEGFEDLDARMRSLVETADAERVAFLALADDDARAFESVMASFGSPRRPTRRSPRGRCGSRRRTRRRRPSRSSSRPKRSADGARRGRHRDGESARGLGRLLGGTAPVRGRPRRDGERSDQRRRPEGRGEGTDASSTSATPCARGPTRFCSSSRRRSCSVCRAERPDARVPAWPRLRRR